jgi:peptidoglycan/LPS O-acetylase OafA/YrhL
MKKILPLQSLRAICVIIVMLVHFHPYHGAFFHNSFLAASAVFTFLALSGFIVSLVYENRINETKDLFVFYKKRFFRMYPMHVLLLFIFLIIEFLKLYIENEYNIISNNKSFIINDGSAFISHLLLINIFNNVLTFNSPAWTVSGEFITSILFGLSCLFIKKKKSKFYFFLISLFGILFVFFISKKNFIEYTTIYSLLSVIYSFITGYFCFRIYYLKNKLFFILSNNLIQLVNFVFLVFLIYFKILVFILPICSGIIIIFLCRINEENLFTKIFFNKFLIYSGKISYTLYITHYLVFWIYTQLYRHIFGIENLNSFDNSLFIENSTIFYIVKILLSFITSYAISHFLYNKFEKKFI